MSGNRRSDGLANFGTKRAPASRPAPRWRRLAEEVLEGRLMLAQTTGLFFHEPEAADGYVLFAPNTANTTFLINKDGQVVNTWQSQHLPGLLGFLQPDGSLIRDAAVHGQSGNGFINAAGAGGLLERFDWDGNKNWEFAYDSPTVLAHHDFEIMPNGNLLLIAWELKSEVAATQAGRDPNLPGDGYLYPDHIVEVQPDFVNGGGTVVWEWHVWDHLVQEFDPTKDNYQGPTGVEDNPQLVDLNFVSTLSEGGGQAEDWTHANGIDYNADLDQIALSVREFSEFWIIDHSTTTAEAAGHTGGNSGRGGDLLYRWGNPQAYDRGDAGDRTLYFQHDVRWIPEGLPGAGNITVFNNGLARPETDFSSVEEITPPLELDGNYTLETGEAWGPLASTWSYAGPVENFAAIISGAIRLENGNTLITYGVKGSMTEITPQGEEVWKYVNPYAGAFTLGPEDPIPPLGASDPLINTLFVNFVFQAQHYPHDYVPQLTSTVADRQLFYNNSFFDGSTPGVSELDDGAIATDKEAYLPGSPAIAVFNNVSSYTRGINGLMLDLAGTHGTITADDFTFRVGTNNTLASWTAAPAPVAVSIRLGAGQGGADRVEIIWADGAIRNKWLEVTVAANSHTGLMTPDVFYWGNNIGDSGVNTGAGTFNTSTIDSLSVFATLGRGKPITELRDYNRDGQLTTIDSLVVFANPGALVRLGIPPAEALVAESGSAVASALAIKAGDQGVNPHDLPRTRESNRQENSPSAAPETRALPTGASLAAREQIAAVQIRVDLALDDELLTGLVVQRLRKRLI